MQSAVLGNGNTEVYKTDRISGSMGGWDREEVAN